MKVGSKMLITTDGYFVAPDGKMYRAAHGTIRGVFDDQKSLGVKTNARSTNWYVQIGNLTIAGCQIHYAVECESFNNGKVAEQSWGSGSFVEFERDSVIYNADHPTPS